MVRRTTAPALKVRRAPLWTCQPRARSLTTRPRLYCRVDDSRTIAGTIVPAATAPGEVGRLTLLRRHGIRIMSMTRSTSFDWMMCRDRGHRTRRPWHRPPRASRRPLHGKSGRGFGPDGATSVVVSPRGDGRRWISRRLASGCPPQNPRVRLNLQASRSEVRLTVGLLEALVACCARRQRAVAADAVSNDARRPIEAGDA